ncbi:hypothetical protein EVG20_g5532 [Dentipellis fragilis]|uniref:Protein KES1 n=1 Tax=Dentipellis fragilis TaxID=205917 RepID=A0A4Y9YVF1_9AGAM|nr:hypothetical protein EVG20_g5532 [Dentipellis fragilis]
MLSRRPSRAPSAPAGPPLSNRAHIPVYLVLPPVPLTCEYILFLNIGRFLWPLSGFPSGFPTPDYRFLTPDFPLFRRSAPCRHGDVTIQSYNDACRLASMTGRPVLYDRPAIHPLPRLAHRVPWCVPLALFSPPTPYFLLIRSPTYPCLHFPFSYWCEHPELFAAIPRGKTPEARALAVLKWFICTLKGQYTSRNEFMGSEKKPLNPVLGELFYGYWPDEFNRGQTNLVVEQVSHHPPITAYFISNPSKGLVLQGHSAQKTSFSAVVPLPYCLPCGSIIVRQIGHAVLTVKLPSGEREEYLITLPRLRIDGLWYGSPYIELTEMSYIQSSSGWLSTIEYKGKGYFSGKSHTYKATVTPPGSNNIAHTIRGAVERR